MMNTRFKRNSGCFACEMCKRQTRDTEGNGDVRLCPECYDLAGQINAAVDTGDPHGTIHHEIHRLLDAIVAKGGRLTTEHDCICDDCLAERQL